MSDTPGELEKLQELQDTPIDEDTRPFKNFLQIQELEEKINSLREVPRP